MNVYLRVHVFSHSSKLSRVPNPRSFLDWLMEKGIPSSWMIIISKLYHRNIWLVVYQPLWKIWRSIGMMKFPTEWKNSIHVPVATNQVPIFVFIRPLLSLLHHSTTTKNGSSLGYHQIPRFFQPSTRGLAATVPLWKQVITAGYQVLTKIGRALWKHHRKHSTPALSDTSYKLHFAHGHLYLSIYIYTYLHTYIHGQNSTWCICIYMFMAFNFDILWRASLPMSGVF